MAKKRRRATNGKTLPTGIYERRGRFLFAYRGPDPDKHGAVKQHWSATYATIAEATAARADVLADRANGRQVANSRSLTSAYLAVWLRGRSLDLAPTTRRNYAAAIKRIEPHLGDVTLADLRPQHVRQMLADLRTVGGSMGRPMANSTVTHTLIVLRMAMRQAVSDGLLSKDPTQGVKAPKSGSRKVNKAQMLTPQEVATFLAGLPEGHWIGPVVRLAVETGLRRSELAGLRWSDIDYADGTPVAINVRQVRTNVGYQVVTGPPKSEKSQRRLDIDAHTAEVLRGIRRQQVEWKLRVGSMWENDEADLILTDEFGKGRHPNSLGTTFQKFIDESDLPRVTFHHLRHTYASLALMGGMKPHLLSARLGHASTQITWDTYSHLMPDDEAAAGGVVTAMLYGLPEC